MINKDRLKNICADIGVDLDAQALERFELFASLLVEKNKVLNLTAITDPEGIAVKHFADSLTALRMIELNAGDRVIDVGTGGGFPGIPLLIARPEIELTMLDSTGKKLAFVSQSVEELGLSANVVHARGGDKGRGSAHGDAGQHRVHGANPQGIRLPKRGLSIKPTISHYHIFLFHTPHHGRAAGFYIKPAALLFQCFT